MRVRAWAGAATRAQLGGSVRRRQRRGPSGSELPVGLLDRRGTVRAALQRCRNSDQLRQAAQVAAGQVVDEGAAEMQRADGHEQATGPLQGRARHRGAAAQERLPKPHLPAAALRGGWATAGRGGPPAGRRPGAARPRLLGEGPQGKRKGSAAPAGRRRNSETPASAAAQRPEVRPRRGRGRRRGRRLERGFRDTGGRAGPPGRGWARGRGLGGSTGGGAVPRAAGDAELGFPHRPPPAPSRVALRCYPAAPPPLPPPPAGCPREAPPLPAVLKGRGTGLGLRRDGAENPLVVALRGWGPRRRSSRGASVGLIGSGRGMGNGLRHRGGGGGRWDGRGGILWDVRCPPPPWRARLL